MSKCSQGSMMCVIEPHGSLNGKVAQPAATAQESSAIAVLCTMASSMLQQAHNSASGGLTARRCPQPPVPMLHVSRHAQQHHHHSNSIVACRAAAHKQGSPAGSSPVFQPVYLDGAASPMVLRPPSDAEEDDLNYDMYVDEDSDAEEQPQQQAQTAVPTKVLTPLQQQGQQDRSMSVQSVQWYPGHIARAERQLKEQLKMVDVVLEVRDARIPVATHHPQVAGWVGPKPRLLVINRQDQISESDRRAWTTHYKSTGQRVFWTQGKQGEGVKALKKVLETTSETINKKRAKRGLQPRPVRACVIGFPNIGKSALINRLLGRKAVASAPKPGVTRALQWVRLSGQLDLLDAPGVIPGSFNDQISAQRLAVCNDIGEAAYVDSLIAQSLVVRCKMLPAGPALMKVLRERYGVDPEEGTAEDFVLGVANRLFLGDTEKAGQRILKDYRNGLLGAFALELPDDIDEKRMREIDAIAAKAQAAAKRKTKSDDDDGF